MAQYQPNHIPARSRWLHAIFAIGILAYGAWGLWVDDLYLPGRRGPGIHLKSYAAWLMFGAMASASTLMALVVVDHYDQRNNERDYKRGAERAATVMGALFVFALVAHLMQVRGQPRGSDSARSTGPTMNLQGADFDRRQRAIADRPRTAEVDAYEAVVARPISDAAFACRQLGQADQGGFSRFVVLARVSTAGDLSELAVQPTAPFSDCMVDKLRTTRLPTPPATSDADGFPLLFVFTLSG